MENELRRIVSSQQNVSIVEMKNIIYNDLACAKLDEIKSRIKGKVQNRKYLCNNGSIVVEDDILGTFCRRYAFNYPNIDEFCERILLGDSSKLPLAENELRKFGIIIENEHPGIAVYLEKKFGDDGEIISTRHPFFKKGIIRVVIEAKPIPTCWLEVFSLLQSMADKEDISLALEYEYSKKDTLGNYIKCKSVDGKSIELETDYRSHPKLNRIIHYKYSFSL